MPTNDFKPFATGGGANVISQADYIIATWLATGFPTTGMDKTAYSNALNKVWRQSAFMAAMIGQFIETELAIDVLDDGDLNGKTTNFIAAIQTMINAVAGNYDPAGAAAAVSALCLKKAADLSDLASVPTALGNLGISLQGIAKAWIRFDATTGAVANSFGPVSGVTRLGQGIYQVNFSIVIPTNSYLSSPSVTYSAGIDESARSTSDCTFTVFDTTNHNAIDAGEANIIFYW